MVQFDGNADPDRLYWDVIVAEGRALVADNDSSSWGLGEMALRVETTYGGGELQKYADAIGINADTLGDYRYVVARFPGRPGDLVMGVLRAIARVDDETRRQELVEQAQREHWTVSRARRAIAQELEPKREPEPRGRKNPGMSPGTRRTLQWFEGIRKAHQPPSSDYSEAEDEQIAASLGTDERRAAEQAVIAATEFSDRWMRILSLDVASGEIE